MRDLDPTRRTALRALALVGVGAAGGTGVAAANEHDNDDHDDRTDDHDNRTDGDADDERTDAGLYVAPLEPQEDANALGIAIVQERQDGLKFSVSVQNLEDAFMAHIHEDEALGPIAAWLYDFETQDERPEEGTFSGLLDVGTITDEVVDEGRAPEAESETVDGLLEKIDAGEAYVNVHTEAYPSGAIAGRLVPFDPSIAIPPGYPDEDQVTGPDADY